MSSASDTLDAGELGAWFDTMQRAVRGEVASDVPCAGCTACCRAAQFVLVEPDEADTLARIPAELLFPAPRMPHGHRLLGYDERGHCPMLVDDRCSIYEHRPRACRAYDCRVFAATGIEPDDATKAEVLARVRRWRFPIADADDRARLDAVRAAGRFLVDNADALFDGGAPSPTQLAGLAIEVSDEFLGTDPPALATIAAALRARRPR